MLWLWAELLSVSKSLKDLKTGDDDTHLLQYVVNVQYIPAVTTISRKALTVWSTLPAVTDVLHVSSVL